MAHGGKREGAGRKRVVAKRKNILIGLPVELVEWLDAQPESRAALIERAIHTQRGGSLPVKREPATDISFDDHPAFHK